MANTRSVPVVPLLELRAELLRPLLAAVAVLSLAYLLAGLAGVRATHLYPWDALGLIALCGVCAWMVRGSPTRVALAAAFLLAGVSQPMIYASQTFGLAHPINGLFLVGIVLCGLVVGGAFTVTWSVFYCGWIVMMAAGEVYGWWTPTGALKTWAELGPVAAVWCALIAVTGAGTWLFANTLERAVVSARGQALALARTSDALAADSTTDSLLEQVLAALADQLQVQFASLFRLEPQDQTLRLYRAVLEGKVLAPDAVPGTHLDPMPVAAVPVWQEMSRLRRPFVIADVRRDPRLVNRERMIAEGIRAVLYVPVLSGPDEGGQGEGELIGLLAINRTDRRAFGSDEIVLAQALMRQLSLAMQITRLTQATRDGAIQTERNRMAREIHDTLAQGFTGIVIQLEAAEDAADGSPHEAAEHIARARALARESLAEARRSVWALRPTALTQRTLTAALRESVLTLANPAGIAARFEFSPELPALDPALEDDLLRIALEAVTNALKYAQATTLTLNLRSDSESVTLQVADDGRGLAARPAPGSGGFGLIGMRERAARHSGSLAVETGPAGTTVTAEIPLTRKVTT